MSRYLIFEDTPDEFRRIKEAINKIDNDAIIYPVETELKNFRKSYLEFILDTADMIKANKIKEFSPETIPDYVIMDFSLLNNSTGERDSLGGEIRQSFIKKNYPNTKVIFISVYDYRHVELYMEPSDIFVSKLLHDDTDVNQTWEKQLKFHLNK